MDIPLVQLLGEYVQIPTTYAGGGNSLKDLELVTRMSKGKLDLTIGSALDIFGGTVKYADLVAFNQSLLDKNVRFP